MAKQTTRRRITLEIPHRDGAFPIASGASAVHTGAAGELAASAAFLRLGYEVVTRTVSHAAPFDLVVAKTATSKLRRVEVKVGTRHWRRDGTSTLSCMVAITTRREFDWLALIDPTSGYMLLATPTGKPVRTR